MKLYKYRDLSFPDEEQFERLSKILHRNVFWCARPSELNDPEEFRWECDYQPTDDTIPLLSRLLMKSDGRNETDAQMGATLYVSTGALEPYARELFNEMIRKCRNKFGLACFGSSLSNKDVMWQRYGGNGAGVCIEIDVPSELLAHQLHVVQYPPIKRLHIDQLLGSCLNRSDVNEVYSVSLLSKSSEWEPEAEIRFVSRIQNVPVCIDRSHISHLTLGPMLSPHSRQMVQNIVSNLPYHLPVSLYVA
jgi:hypothetical protein